MALLLTTNPTNNFDTTTFKEVINDVFPTQTGTVLALTTERFRTVTFSRNATIQGVIVGQMIQAALGTNIRGTQVELQEFTGGSWVTRASGNRPAEVNTTPFGIYLFYIPFSAPYVVNTTVGIRRLRIINIGTTTATHILVSPTTNVPFSAFVTTDTLAFNNGDRVMVSDGHEFFWNKTATITAPAAFEDPQFGYAFYLLNNAKCYVPGGTQKKVTQNGAIFNSATASFNLGTAANHISTKGEFEREIGRSTGSTNVNGTMFKFSGSTTSSYHLGGEFNCQYVDELTEKEFELASDAAASQKNLVLTQAPTTWVNGDHIRIDKNEVQTQGDLTRHTIGSIAGTALVTAANLLVKRVTGAKVINSSRNAAWIYPAAGLTYISSAVGGFSNFVFKGCWAFNVVFQEAMVNATYITNSTLAFPNRTVDIIGNSLEHNQATAYYFYAGFAPKKDFYVQRNHMFRINIFQTLNAIYTATYKAGYLIMEDIINISPYVSEFYTTTTLIKTKIKRYRVCNNTASVAAGQMKCNFLNSEIDGIYFYGFSRPAFWFINNNGLQIKNAIYEYCAYSYLFEGTIIDVVDNSPTVINNTVATAYYLGTNYGKLLVKNPNVQMDAGITIYDAIPGTALAIVNNGGVQNTDKYFATVGEMSRCGIGLADTKVLVAGDDFSLRQKSNGADILKYSIKSPMGNQQGKMKAVSIYCEINSANYYAGTYQLPRLVLKFDGGTSEVYAQALPKTGIQQLLLPFVPTTDNPEIEISLTSYTDAIGTDNQVYRGHMEGNIPNIGSMNNWVDGLPINDVGMLETNADYVAGKTLGYSLSLLTVPGTIGRFIKDGITFIQSVLGINL